MARDYTITSARNAGEKDNPHGGTLVKWYLKLADSEAGDDDVYTQKKPGNDLAEGMSIHGRLEKGEFGWRFFSEQKDGSGSQGSSGGTFNRHFERVPDNIPQDPQRWSIERQVAAKCAAEVLKGGTDFSAEAIDYLVDAFHDAIRGNDADLGGGPKSTEASPPTADVSAGAGGGAGTGRETVPRTGPSPSSEQSLADTEADLTEMKPGDREASPAQKGKLTNLFGKANLSRDAMKAVVLFRCRSEKATKDGASKLIQDLMDGATHDTLLAEIHDAKRAGDPLAIRAAKLIPSDTPLAEDPEEKAKEYEDESGVPF